MLNGRQRRAVNVSVPGKMYLRDFDPQSPSAQPFADFSFPIGQWVLSRHNDSKVAFCAKN
jgi:hypothetical protein